MIGFLALTILNSGIPLSMVCAVIGLAFAFVLIGVVIRAPSGNERMRGDRFARSWARIALSGDLLYDRGKANRKRRGDTQPGGTRARRKSYQRVRAIGWRHLHKSRRRGRRSGRQDRERPRRRRPAQPGGNRR